MLRRPVLLAIVSSALFGASTPVGKALLASVHPAVLAGLLYCGAGIGIAVLRRLQVRRSSPVLQLKLGTRDLPWLAGAVFSGGMVGPLLLLVGLAQTNAATASLLLTLEGAATAFLARLLFREQYGARLIFGMTLLLSGAAVLAWAGAPNIHSMIGPLAIVGACVAWGLDNNLTRKISLADPLRIVEVKGLIAGPVNLGLGLWVGASLPGTRTMLIAGAVGFVCYGLSLVFYILSLRDLGAARTSAYFSTAPFIGAVGSILFLGEQVTVQHGIAGLLMAAGIWLHLTEQHRHEHAHLEMEHTHLHQHDSHHQHPHRLSDSPGEPHAHRHRHGRLTHVHDHTPDMHHTHKH